MLLCSCVKMYTSVLPSDQYSSVQLPWLFHLTLYQIYYMTHVHTGNKLTVMKSFCGKRHVGHKHRGAIQQDSEPYLLLPLVCVCSYLNFSLTSLEKRPKKARNSCSVANKPSKSFRHSYALNSSYKIHMFSEDSWLPFCLLFCLYQLHQTRH